MCEDRITPLLEDILACIVARFDDCGEPEFCRVGPLAGVVAWDDCCDCGNGDGQLWARVADWQPDPVFEPPNPGAGCSQPSLITVGVGALRCVPVLDESGAPPAAADLAYSAARIHADTQLVYDAVMCCLPERTWAGWLPLGSEGGCGGGEHLWTIPFVPCNCSEVITS